jgi:hypothetical protein
MEMILDEWDKLEAFDRWQLQMISSEELTQLDKMFRIQLSVLEEERKILFFWSKDRSLVVFEIVLPMRPCTRGS